MRRAVIGVNHLAYGRDGYGLLLPGTQTVDPVLVALQREIGFGSLRYPGGCGGTHPFSWKRNAGLEGPCRVLGVTAFMDMCENVGADPILGISSHRGTPVEAAQYVEFLNAPADDAHPWAQKRAARGRLRPYAARFFEYGNETYHGTHPGKDEPRRQIRPEGYAENYLEFRAAMKAVDPKILLGAVLTAQGSGWNRRVLARIGGVADFFVRHTYCAVPERTTEDGYLSLFLDRRRDLEKMLADQVAEGVRFGYGGGKRTTDAGTSTAYAYDDGTHVLRFLDDRAMNFFHLQACIGNLPKGDRCDWKVSCRMRIEDMAGEDVKLVPFAPTARTGCLTATLPPHAAVAFRFE